MEDKNAVLYQISFCIYNLIFATYLIKVLDNMSVWRVILSVLFPPLAVYDRGCGSILIVLILTILGWIPGVIAALIILNNPRKGV
ncbi:hypothetical protein AO058_07390 [Salegentibacter sp. T436]|nr:hypothetical protein AO058_07390 [Salegentibacter sp. T436]